MSDFAEVCRILAMQTHSFEQSQQRTAERFERMENALGIAQRPDLSDGSNSTTMQAPAWKDAKTGAPVLVLDHKSSVASALGHQGAQVPSIGRFLRGVVMGGRADDARELDEERKALGIVPDTSGGFTVTGALSSQWIDLLRANMVLDRAGALTVPMSNPTLTMAKLTGDATVSWHAENAALGNSDPTFGAIELRAKTVVSMVRMSLEISQDSANIEQVLQSSLVSAMSHEIDRAGLLGATTDAAGAPLGVFNMAGRSKATGIGAPTNWDFLVDALYTLQASNVPLDSIGAFIAHPALWKKLRKLKTGISGDQTSLIPPPEIAALPKLWTTAAPFTGGTTCAGIVGDWRSLLFGVRQQIAVRVLQEAFMGSNLQVAVIAYARCDFASIHDESFYTAEGITV